MEEARDPKKPLLSNNESKVIKIIFVIGLIYVVTTMFGIQLVNDEFNSYFKENGETILSLSVLLFSIIVLFSIYGVVIDDGKKNKKLKRQVTFESFSDTVDDTKELNIENLESNNVNVAFCQSDMSSSEKDANCKKLTKGNCTTIGCCVLLNGEKCVGGGESGPTYLNENGKDIDVKYYMYKDICKGNGCPM